MSHTLYCADGTSAVFNGDFSGDVQFTSADGKPLGTVPFSTCKRVVATWIRYQRIAALEQMTDDEVLEVPAGEG